jgi:D-alanine-D-alanine ligase
MRVGLLSKERGNFSLQRKFLGNDWSGVDTTSYEIAHHKKALLELGHEVRELQWGSHIIEELTRAKVDIFFNVSSLAEAVLLEELGLKYVGSPPHAISAATDKQMAKMIFRESGIPTAPFYSIDSLEDCSRFSEARPFPYPAFVKPRCGRGSAGITPESVVSSDDRLVNAARRILETMGHGVLVEPFLRGREITIGLIGNGGNVEVLPLLEIEYAQGGITLTFDKKESDNDNFICPAPLDGETADEIIGLARKAYRALGFRDYGRFDTILTEEGLYFLEGNTFAGLTTTPVKSPSSYMGRMARGRGWGGKELMGKVLEAAVKRYCL